MFSHPGPVYLASIGQYDGALYQGREHELVYGGRGRMDPAKLLGLTKLVRRKGIAEHDFRFGDVFTEAFRRVQLIDFKLREFASQPFGEPWRRDPKIDTMISDNEQLAFGR